MVSFRGANGIGTGFAQPSWVFLKMGQPARLWVKMATLPWRLRRLRRPAAVRIRSRPSVGFAAEAAELRSEAHAAEQKAALRHGEVGALAAAQAGRGGGGWGGLRGWG